jgi:hypothetical protein
MGAGAAELEQARRRLPSRRRRSPFRVSNVKTETVKGQE